MAPHRDVQLGAHGHGALGRSRGRRRAKVGDKVDDGPVRLMADGGDERDRVRGDRAGDELVIETP
jgi:hypothetical protein